MIVSFKDEGTRDIWEEEDTREARKTCPRILWTVARRKLLALDSARNLDELRRPPGNRLERLVGDRFGSCSIRINDQWRICFRWEPQGAAEVEIVDYH